MKQLLAKKENKNIDTNTEKASFSDPAFMSNKVLPVHKWVPWIAGFSSDFVKDAINHYMEKDKSGIILDPFSGVGTTLVEAVLEGHNAIGFEVNPYASLASKIKATAYKIDHNKLKKEVLKFNHFYQESLSNNYTPKSSAPSGFNTRGEFYSPDVLHKVLIVQDYINSIKQEEIRDIFRLVFGATMVRYSNYSYEPSLGQRKSSGKPLILDFEVGETILSKLQEIIEDVIWFKTNIKKDKKPFAQVHNVSFFEYENYIEPESVDLLITSPPYLNNYHYIRNTRPQLYWLGFAEKPKDIKPLEHLNFGTYWQTARDAEKIDLDFEINNCDIKERLQILREANPNKGSYGGNGWANYAASYFNDCYKFSQGIMHCMKHGGTALVVLGNSILQGIEIPVDLYFAKIAETVGLQLVEIHISRVTRVGNSIVNSQARTGEKTKASLYEAIVEIRKP